MWRRRAVVLLMATAVLSLPVLPSEQPSVTLRFAPPKVRWRRHHDAVEFSIEAIPARTLRTPLDVDLTLIADGGRPHVYRAKKSAGNTYRVTAVPVPLDEIRRLRLTLLDETSEASFTSLDRELTVGGKRIQLSAVRRIELVGQPRVITQKGQVLTGELKGLEALETQVAGTPVRLQPAKASRILVDRAPSPTPTVAYRVLVRTGRRTVAEQRGFIPIVETGQPAVPQLQPADGPIAFAPPQVHQVPEAQDFLAIGDLDQDGWPDVVVAAGEELGVLYGHGDGTLEPYQRLVAWKAQPLHPEIADLNGDGLPEILFLDHSGRLVTLPNLGGRRFGEPKFQGVGDANYLQVADFNGDHRPDVALAFSSPSHRGMVKLLLGQADGTFQEHVTLDLPNYSDTLAVGDVDGDGKTDIVAANMTLGEGRSGPMIFYGDGSGGFRQGPIYPIGDQNLPGLAVADLNGDGHPDLAATNYWGGRVAVLLNKGDGTFQSPIFYPADRYPIQIRVADFDGDGKPDLVVPHAGNVGISIYRNRGDGTFHDPVTISTGGEDSRSCVVADFNRDKRPDLAIQNKGSRTVTVLLNIGGK